MKTKTSTIRNEVGWVIMIDKNVLPDDRSRETVSVLQVTCKSVEV